MIIFAILFSMLSYGLIGVLALGTFIEMMDIYLRTHHIELYKSATPTWLKVARAVVFFLWPFAIVVGAVSGIFFFAPRGVWRLIND